MADGSQTYWSGGQPYEFLSSPDDALGGGLKFFEGGMPYAYVRFAVYLSGTVACSSSVSGVLGLTKPLSGASAGTSSVTGALSLTKTLTGTSAGSGAASGGLSLTKGLSGTANGVATVSGVLLAGKYQFDIKGEPLAEIADSATRVEIV